MLKKIVSGGQTGVDRAALDVAIQLNISHGGWCPKGRLAELGEVIPMKYHLVETLSDQPSERTILNIRDSDATLIIVPSLPLEVTDGTILTIQEVKKTGKIHFIFNLAGEQKVQDIQNWLSDNNIEILNIAGPRESQSLGIYEKSFCLLMDVFKS